MTASDHPVRVTDETPLFPPRYRWLKRILAAAGLLLVALIAVRWWWGWNAERKLQAKIAEYHALGQPILPEDFEFPAIPDRDNAAYFLKQAAAQIVTSPIGVATRVEDVCGNLNSVLAKQDDVRSILEANQSVLALVDQALACPETGWGFVIATPISFTNVTDPGHQKQITRLLSASALYHHSVGDDAAALRDLRSILLHSNHIFGRAGSLISQLVFIAIQSFASYDIEAIAPDLKIANGDAPTTAASEPQIRELIGLLLDETIARHNWARAFQWERAASLDLYVSLTSRPGVLTPGTPSPASGLAKLIQPILVNQGVLSLALHTIWAQAGEAPDYPEAAEIIATHPLFGGGFERTIFSDLLEILTPSYDRALQLHYRGLVLRRMAAIALAIKLYEHDHGAPPASLADLAPTYLSEIPVDPFSANHYPLRYLPDAPRPILYSVGIDGEDDGGQYALKDDGAISEDLLDLVFFLDGQRPHAAVKPPTTQASDENNDEDTEATDDAGDTPDDSAADSD